MYRHLAISPVRVKWSLRCRVIPKVLIRYATKSPIAFCSLNNYTLHMTQNPIIAELENARANVASLREQITRLTRHFEIAKARLEAFETASSAFEAAAPKARSGARQQKSRNRLPNADWQAVFQSLHRDHPNGFGYDEIFMATELLGMDAKRPSLRTKMANYVNEGYAQRIDDGKFTITRKGLAHFKVQEIAAQATEMRVEIALKENEPLNGSPASGSEAGLDSRPIHPSNETPNIFD